jgi:hypothetical protein
MDIADVCTKPVGSTAAGDTRGVDRGLPGPPGLVASWPAADAGSLAAAKKTRRGDLRAFGGSIWLHEQEGSLLMRWDQVSHDTRLMYLMVR